MPPELYALWSRTEVLQTGVMILVAFGLLFFWLWRRAARGLIVADQARSKAESHVTALAEREAALSRRLDEAQAEGRGFAIEVSGLTARKEALEAQMARLGDERDALSDALHQERLRLGAVEKTLAETRLSAEKDREAATRELSQLRDLREEMTRHFKVMADETLRVQGADLQKRHDAQLSALLTPFREQVSRFQTELQARNKVMDEESARLREQIQFLHRRSEDISREAVALTRALKGDSQKQGAWGEMVLERILEDSGLEQGLHYVVQESVTDENGKRWRPDVIVKMPQNKALVVDSKVSLLAYEEAVNSEDAPARKDALLRHVKSIRSHIKALGGKGYHALDNGSVDYVLMFIPIEGALSEALREDRELASYAMEMGVGLTTPTTLMLTLRTVNHIWAVERRETNAMEIANRAGALYDKVHGVISAMEGVGKALDNASKAHSDAMSRLTQGPGNLVRQTEMLRVLGAKAQKRITLDHDETDEN